VLQRIAPIVAAYHPDGTVIEAIAEAASRPTMRFVELKN